MAESNTYETNLGKEKWIVLFFLLILTSLVLLFDGRNSIFHFLNSFSLYTGNTLWAALTILGDGLVALVLILPFIRRNPRIIWAALVASLFYLIVGNILKRLLNCPRPPAVLEPHEFQLIGPAWKYHSFPSGHSAMAFIIAGVIAMGDRRKWLGIIAVLWAFLAAVSRAAVGVHWTQDVLAGAALGWGLALLGLFVSGSTDWGWGRTAQKITGGILLLGAAALFLGYDTNYPGVILIQKGLALLLFTAGGWEYLKLWQEKDGKEIPGAGKRS